MIKYRDTILYVMYLWPDSSTTVKYTLVGPTFEAHPHIVTFVVDMVTMCCSVFISIVSKYTY